MLEKIKFDEQELEVKRVDTLYGFLPNKVYNTPISMKENFASAVKNKEALWIPSFNDQKLFTPKVAEDNLCHGFSCEANPFNPFETPLVTDFFGVEWMFEASCNGSIENPANPPRLDTMEGWEKELTVPDPDKWDWEGSGEENKGYLSDGYFNSMWQFNGLFERVRSLLGFVNALTAMIDEDEKPHIHAFLEQMTEYYKKIIRNATRVYDIDLLFFHDDWGTQRAPFMNPETTREMIKPYLKQIVDCAHENGLLFQMHSCGCNRGNVEIMIECGVDIYAPQANANEVDKMYEDFGDQIMLGITPEINAHASEMEVQEFCKRFVDHFAKDFKTRPIYTEDAFFMEFPPTLRGNLYRYSREALS